MNDANVPQVMFNPTTQVGFLSRIISRGYLRCHEIYDTYCILINYMPFIAELQFWVCKKMKIYNLESRLSNN